MIKKDTLLGAHMSIAGGLDQAILRGASINCNTIQIFTQSSRRWGPFKSIESEIINNFIKMQRQHNIETVISHASYLINLGSISQEIAEKSEDALVQELERCGQLNIPYLILHPGSGSELQVTIKQVAKRIKSALNRYQSNTKILLETMAGQGNTIGFTFEQLRNLLDLIDYPKNLGICFDTCHVWAAGYDFSNEEKYNKMWQSFDKIIGLENLFVMHINDSKTLLNSRVDRHENIGEGTLGIETFRLIMNDKRFVNISKIIETPKDDLNADLKNLNILKRLIKSK